MKITVGTWVLAAVLAAGTACDGGDGEKQVRAGKTFRGDGFSFTYPAEWSERTAGPVEAGGVPDVTVGPERRPRDSISVQVTEVGIKIEGKDLSITEENIDENADLLSIGADFVVGIAGGKLGKRERVTVGGLPGFRWEASNLKRGGGRVDGRVTHLFKGLKGYLLTCLNTPEGAAELKRACDQAVSSFRVTSG